jgi:hypothetical protein
MIIFKSIDYLEVSSNGRIQELSRGYLNKTCNIDDKNIKCTNINTKGQPEFTTKRNALLPDKPANAIINEE